MSYALARRLQRQGLRTQHDYRRALFASIKAGLQLVVGLLLLLAVLGWMTERDLRDKEQADAEQAQRVLAHVLNGHTVIDRNDGTMLFVQVSRQKGL